MDFRLVFVVQATTTAQHNLRLEDFEGEEYEGALLYVTLSVNKFAYQSIEEVDPVDGWALLGTAGGVWGKSTRMVVPILTLKQSTPFILWSQVSDACGKEHRHAAKFVFSAVILLSLLPCSAPETPFATHYAL